MKKSKLKLTLKLLKSTSFKITFFGAFFVFQTSAYAASPIAMFNTGFDSKLDTTLIPLDSSQAPSKYTFNKIMKGLKYFNIVESEIRENATENFYENYPIFNDFIFTTTGKVKDCYHMINSNKAYKANYVQGKCVGNVQVVNRWTPADFKQQVYDAEENEQELLVAYYPFISSDGHPKLEPVEVGGIDIPRLSNKSCRPATALLAPRACKVIPVGKIEHISVINDYNMLEARSKDFYKE